MSADSCHEFYLIDASSFYLFENKSNLDRWLEICELVMNTHHHNLRKQCRGILMPMLNNFNANINDLEKAKNKDILIPSSTETRVEHFFLS